MNDEQLEHHLRQLPAPELPPAWRQEILARAMGAATPAPRSNWPDVVLFLRQFFAQNPITSGALAALWLLIFFFKASTPLDPTASQGLIVRIDPKRPVYLTTLRQELLVAQLLPDEPDRNLMP